MIDNKTQKPSERTKRTQGTTVNDKGVERSLTNQEQRTERTSKFPNNQILELQAIDPLQSPPEKLMHSIINRPCYKVHDDCFQIGNQRKKPGLYWHLDQCHAS